MKKFQRTICVLLTVILLFSLGVPAFGANTATTDKSATAGNTATSTTNATPFSIEISTDRDARNGYGFAGTANITVEVTNTSGTVIDNVSAEALFDGLSPVGRNNTLKAETTKLNNGESLSFSYTAMINKDYSGLNIFQKIILFFVRLFRRSVSVSDNGFNNGRAYAQAEETITFGKFDTKNTVRVWYGTSYSTRDIKEVTSLYEVNNIIGDFMEGEEYNQLPSNEDRVESIRELLNELSSENIIKSESIKYYPDENCFWYELSSGIKSFVFLDEPDHRYVGKSNGIIESEEVHTFKQLSLNTLATNRSFSSDENINIVFMYGFDKSDEFYSCYKKYDNLMRQYSQTRFTTKIYDNPTIEDFKTAFLETEYICILEHGAYNGQYSYFQVLFEEDISSIKKNAVEKLLNYKKDIDSELIFYGKSGNKTIFCIAPKFFEHYYSGNKLKDAIVFLFCCNGFGNKGEVSYILADAFRKCGASTVIGFHNSVFEEYAFPLYKTFTDHMLSGKTVNEALNIAKQQWGNTDVEYGTKYFPLSEYWNKPDPRDGKTLQQALAEQIFPAKPLLRGDENKTFKNTIYGTVTGYVKEDGTNTALENVTVVATNGETTITGLTNSAGKFTISLPVGTWNISVESSKNFYCYTKVSVDVEQGKETTLSTPFYMKHGNEVTGVVKDNNTKQPISGANVLVMKTNSATPLTTTSTNTNGEFSLNLEAGTYILTFNHNDYEQTSKNVTVSQGYTVDLDKIYLTPKGSSGGEDEDNPGYSDGIGSADDFTNINKVGGIIQFGSYPQSEVTDSATISALNSRASDWQSYGYYTGSGSWNDGKMTASNYMQYCDVKYGGSKYRGIKFSQYRLHYTGDTSSAGYSSYQDDNGYTTGTNYWFKYEPLKWRVLDPSTGLVMCATIIDSQPYNNYVLLSGTDTYGRTAYWGDAGKTYFANDYANSSLREWLMHDFYATAFTKAQQDKIAVNRNQNNDGYYTLTGNTNYSDYDSDPTNDKIFLLSYNEVLNSGYGFATSRSTYDTARRLQGSDYAKCQGLWVVSTSSSYYGNSWWWLRSPGYDSNCACAVTYYGDVYYSLNHVNFTFGGVCPAFKLSL